MGNRTKATVAKSKVSSPFKKAEFDIMFGKGISRSGDLVDLGVLHGIVDKTGAWYSYGDTRLGQGRENSKTFLESTPEIADEIERSILEKVGMANIRDHDKPEDVKPASEEE